MKPTTLKVGFAALILCLVILLAGAGVDADLLVSNTFGSNILRFDENNGAFLGIYVSGPELAQPSGMAYGPDGHFYVVAGGNVLRYNGQTRAFMGVFAAPTAPSFISMFGGLAFGPDGNLYISTFSSNRIVKYSPTGDFIGEFVSRLNSPLQDPIGLTFGSDGQLYIAGFNGFTAWLRFDLNRVLTAQVQLADGVHSQDLTFGPDGNLYVSSYTNSDVVKYSVEGAGAVIGTFVTSSSGGLANAAGLRFTPDGQYLLVASGNTNSILRYNAETGAFVDVFIQPGSGGLSIGSFPAAFLAFTPSAPGGPLDLIDPVSGLLSGATISTNCSLLGLDPAGLTRALRTGVAADGVAKLILRFRPTVPGTVQFTILTEGGQPSISEENGSLSGVSTCGSPTSGGQSITVSTVNANPLGLPVVPRAIAVYNAPANFARVGRDDGSVSQREIRIQTVFTPASGGPPQTFVNPMRIVRPPVALVHGIWSGIGAWDRFAALQPFDTLPSDTENMRFFSRRIDYSDANAKHFVDGAGIVGVRIKDLVAEYRDKASVAVVQADVVAHSMGGNVIRTATLCGSAATCQAGILPYNYKRSDNFEQGDFHRLVTIGTPHLGTPLATLFFSHRNDVCRQVTKGILTDDITLADAFSDSFSVFLIPRSGLGLPIDKGAVQDLVDAPQSEPLSLLQAHATNLPTHFIVGIASTGASSDEEVANKLLKAGVGQYCPPFGSALPASGITGIFGEANDIIVSVTSQRKGSATAQSAISQDPARTVIHTNALEIDIAGQQISFPSLDELEADHIAQAVVAVLNASSPVVFDPLP